MLLNELPKAIRYPLIGSFPFLLLAIAVSIVVAVIYFLKYIVPWALIGSILASKVGLGIVLATVGYWALYFIGKHLD